MLKRRNVEMSQRRNVARRTAQRCPHFDVWTFGRLEVSRKRTGMALIDVIIGALLLGVGLAVILSLSSRSLASQTEGERIMVASWLADELLSMVLVEGPEDYRHLYDMDGWFYEPFDDYFYSVEIIDNGEGMAYTVTATVGWEQGRDTREIQIQAAIAARGGEPEQIREPYERLDREQRDYERLFGDDLEDEEAEEGPTWPILPPPGGGSGASEKGEESPEQPGDGGERGGEQRVW